MGTNEIAMHLCFLYLRFMQNRHLMVTIVLVRYFSYASWYIKLIRLHIPAWMMVCCHVVKPPRIRVDHLKEQSLLREWWCVVRQNHLKYNKSSASQRATARARMMMACHAYWWWPALIVGLWMEVLVGTGGRRGVSVEISSILLLAGFVLVTLA